MATEQKDSEVTVSSSSDQLERLTRKIGKYEFYETIGKGGYSWVKRGKDTATGASVALKFMTRADDEWALEQAEQVRTEIKALTNVRHPNVMKLYAYNLSAKYPTRDNGVVKTILLVLEFCPGGELFDVLYYADRVEEACARTYFHQMMGGLEACHKAGIAHRDIKPQNLLLDADFQLKITDFGLSKIIESDADYLMKTTYVGTRGYQAPELLNNKKYTNACDVFSMGVVLFIMLAGYPPFERAHKSDRWFRPLAKGDNEAFWRGHQGCPVPKEARSLLTGMLCYKPNRRITIDEIKEHPWWTGATVTKKEMKEKILIKFKEARQKRKLDARKMEDLKGLSLEPDVPAGGVQRDIDDERVFTSVAEFNQMTPTQKMKHAVAPKVTEEDKPRGLTTFYSRFTAYSILQSLDYVFRRQFPSCSIDRNEGEWNKFTVTFRLLNSDNQPDYYRMSVEVFRDCDSCRKIVLFNLIEGQNRFAWIKLYRQILDVVLSYNILDQGIGRRSVDPELLTDAAKPDGLLCAKSDSWVPEAVSRQKSGDPGLQNKELRSESLLPTVAAMDLYGSETGEMLYGAQEEELMVAPDVRSAFEAADATREMVASH